MKLPTPGITPEGVRQNFDYMAQVMAVELDTTALTSAGIDAILKSHPSAVVVSDPVNHRLLVRQAGAWYYTNLVAV